MFDKIVEFVEKLEKSDFTKKIGLKEYKLVMDTFYKNPDSPLYIVDVQTRKPINNFARDCFYVTDVKKRLIVSGDNNQIWVSGYRHMYNQIMREHYGDEVIMCGYNIREVIDIIDGIRNHFRFRGNNFNLITKMMVNSLYPAIRDLTDIIDKQFYVLAKEKFDRTVEHIKSVGGYPIYCEVDHFIYASPEIIPFETATHNDKLKNIMVIDEWVYVSNIDQHQSRRVRALSLDDECVYNPLKNN